MKTKYNTEEERIEAKKASDRIRSKRYWHKHKDDEEFKAKNRARYAKFYKEHKDEKNAYDAKHYLTKNRRATCLLSCYRRDDKAKNRGECTLTAEWIVENVFSGQVCHYCGESDWTKLGVDRIDNSLPHTPENVVPCCWDCNTKKGRKNYNEYLESLCENKIEIGEP